MLDPDQANVVAHEEGPAAVLAGAGSGKTRCTTERAARRLTESRVPGAGMVLLTFTNKAAGEMRERLAARLPNGVDLPWIGTFHSFGNQLLRRYGRLIGVPRNATLMDSEDARRMLDALLAGPFSDKVRRQKAMDLHEVISANGLDITHPADLQPIKERMDAAGFGPVAASRLMQRLRRYDREKREAGVLDFSDLILLPARLLRQETALAADLRGTLQDVTVDEAQDTDGAQFRLLGEMIPENRTVLLVGDDDQAIYEWRHARPDNMRDFIEQHRATVYRLERNYRSTPAIVNGGATLVRNNASRLEKNPYPVRTAPAGDHIRLELHGDAEQMAERLADRIRKALDQGVPPEQVAVLYRKNRLARPVESALLRLGVPYRIKAGMDLLSFADVRMMLAAGRLAANRRDVRALSRLADLVPGLGSRGVGRLMDGSENPLANAWRLTPQAAAAVERLARAIETLQTRGPAQLLDWCLQTPLFNDWLVARARRSVQARNGAGRVGLDTALRPALSRMGTVQRAMARRLDTLPADATPEARWGTALEIIAAGTEEADATDGRVTLCSIHAAKGLEWPAVHVFGFSEGLMPMAREGAVANLAEERRLAYVAITRAQSELVLHHADRIDMGNGRGEEAAVVSRFLDELGPRAAIRQLDHRLSQTARVGERAPTNREDWLQAMRRVVDR
ncbi:MAG: ATP-dependent helicase [Ectothiorhodospiraceae bacterium]|nr:ATP-dependent helicase [Ectothiorhodospiraceae bacterium]